MTDVGAISDEGTAAGTPIVTAVIGDVVGSRQASDQRQLLQGVAARLAMLRHAARRPGMTVGDEFQAVYLRPARAIADLARLRMSLLVDPPADAPVRLRVGFGVGAVAADAADPADAPAQAGPGWWHARAALDWVGRPRRAWPELAWWIDGEGGDLGALRAALIALDALSAGFDDTDRRLALGLLDGATASGMAGDIGLARQSVDARLHHHGVYGWVRALEGLQEPEP